MRPSIVVMAKAPVAGRSKTRLSPPCTPAEAAWLAESALVDTLHAVRRADARAVLALEGEPGPWLRGDTTLVVQKGTGLDERIAHALLDAGGPALVIGMDTPQVTPKLLDDAIHCLMQDGVGAVLGRAADGGWWALGSRAPDPRVVLGVPMSSARTGDHQHARLHHLGIAHRPLPMVRDVDTFVDARRVAAQIPASEFAHRVRAVSARLGSAASATVA